VRIVNSGLARYIPALYKVHDQSLHEAKKKDEIYPHLQDLDLIIGQAVTEDEECVKEAIDSVVQWLVLEEKAAEADLAALSLERDGEAELEAAENEEALEVD